MDDIDEVVDGLLQEDKNSGEQHKEKSDEGDAGIDSDINNYDDIADML